MHFGATMRFTEYSISPTELAVALEERGFELLWASEHSHLLPDCLRIHPDRLRHLITQSQGLIAPFGHDLIYIVF